MPTKTGWKMQTVKMSKEQAQIFAAAIRPQIKEYIENNRDKFEAWLQAEQERELAKKIGYKK